MLHNLLNFIFETFTIKNVAVTTDLFRNSTTMLDSVSNNARWIHTLLKPIFQKMQIESELILSDSDGGVIDARYILNKLNIQCDKTGWAHSTNTPDLELAIDQLRLLLKNDLIIGFGLTPSLIYFLDRHSVKVIDIEISPYRFGKNWYFKCRTNDKRIEVALRTIEISQDLLSQTAIDFLGILARRYQYSPQEVDFKAGLIVGQYPIDLALVEGGVIRSLQDDDIFDYLRRQASLVDIVYISPHPEMKGSISNIDCIHRSLSNSVISSYPSYSYLALCNLCWVDGLSSSLLEEAKLFGKKSNQLIKPDRDYSPILPNSLSSWICVTEDLLSLTFWQALISKKKSKRNFQRDRDIIRSALGVSNYGLHGQNTSVKKPNVYELGVTYATNVNGLGVEALYSSWQVPESWGTWSAANYSTMVFSLNYIGTCCLSLQVRIFESPTVSLSINGGSEFTPLYRSANNGAMKFSITLTTSEVNKIWVLRFRFDAPVVPSDIYPESKDRRCIALGVESFYAHAIRNCAINVQT